MRRVIVVVALVGLVACGKSKRERCEAMTAHQEAIQGTPMSAPERTEYIDLCTQAAFDREIDCNLAAKTRDDLMRCAGGPP